MSSDVYRAFVKTAIAIALTAGCTLGAITLAVMAVGGSVGTTWASVTQAHGHTQIFGWVGLFVMGIAYHVLPRLKATELRGRPLALASFWLMLTGLLLRAASQPFATDATLGSLVVTSGILELAAVCLFAFVALRTIRSIAQPADFYEKWILASVGWFGIAALANLAIDVYLARNALDVVPAVIEVPFLHISLFGFVGTIIFGITLRTVPLFMGLKAPNKKAFDVLFWVINPAIAAKAVALLLSGYGVATADAALPWVSALELAATLGFVYFLNIFRKPEINVGEEGADQGYEKYIRAAYVWLAVAATMTASYAAYQGMTGHEVPHAFVGAYRHALTVGFISMMIMGMASRIIPVFAGVRLHSERILLASFVLVNVGNTMRVLSQPLASIAGGPFFATMGASGFIEVTALALFGYNIWKTMDKIDKEETKMTEARVTVLDVRELPPWERHPKILDLFDSLEPGDAIKLVNDHDPRPLHYQFLVERKDRFEWESHEENPREWVAMIRKVA